MVCRVIFILLIPLTVSLTATFTLGASSQKRPRWLNKPPPADLSYDERDKHQHLEYMFSLLDTDEDGKISLAEIGDKLSFLSFGKPKPVLGYDELKYMLKGYPPLMEENVFEDMWWLLTRGSKPDQGDYTNTFFNYADTNGNKLVEREELETVLVNGGRTKKSPSQNTPYHDLFVQLDRDASGSLDGTELMNPIFKLLKSQPDGKITTLDFAKLVQDYTTLSPSLLDGHALALCLDTNQDSIISLKEGRKDFLTLLDKNYNDVVDEHEMMEIAHDLASCVETLKQKSKDEL